MGVKVMVAVTAAETARYTEFWDSLLQVNTPPDTVVRVARGASVAENRNGLTALALGMGAEWIWYVDDDHIFAPDTLPRLLAHNLDYVSGLYVAREFPFKPQAYGTEDERGYVSPHLLDPDTHGVIPVLATGAGCLLVRCSVFAKLEAPYWTLGQIVKDGWGDDVDFCRRLRAAGVALHCDTDIVVGHKSNVTLWPQRTADGSGWMTTLVVGKVPVAHFPAPQSAFSPRSRHMVAQ